MRNHILTSRLAPFVLSALPQRRLFPDPAPDPGGEGGKGAPPPPPPAKVEGAPPPAKDGNSGQFSPDWLNDRLAQAKRSAETDLLKSLGYTDAAAAKKAGDDLKKLQDASKTESERKDEELKTANAKAKEADAYKTLLAGRAEQELLTLPDAARASIKALAGDDPVKLLNAIDLAKAMATPPPAAGTPPVPGAKAPVPPPANTSNAGGNPDGATTSPVNHLAVWRDYKAKNPFAAAQYMLMHQQAIVAGLEAESKPKTG